MRDFASLPLERKLTLIVVLTTAFGMVLTSIAIIAYQTFTFTNFMISELETVADVLGKNGTAALRFQAKRDAENTLASLRAKPNITGARFLNPDGSTFAMYARSPNLPPQLEVPLSEGYAIDLRQLTWTKYVYQDGDLLGAIYIESDVGVLYRQLFHSISTILLITLIAAALALFLGIRFLRTVSEPINHLIHTANRISEERDYSLRAEQYAADDLGALTVEFNEMLAEIELRDAEMERRVRERTEALSHANQTLESSLEEKVVLLKEIHHRVKNNLQIISSLLSLQARDIADARDLDLFVNSQNRVQTMALIHERLYQSDDLARVDFTEYIPVLVDSLFTTYKTSDQDIELRVEVSDLMLDLDQAIPCGLMINELISNALKYAFPDGRSGSIYIGLRAVEEKRVELEVADDGVGLPADVTTRGAKTLGLQLIQILTRQLRGRFETKSRERGAHFCITFPLMEERAVKNLV